MQIQGKVFITVDPVDIEQACLSLPALAKGATINMKANLAARQDENFIKLWRLTRANNQAIEWEYSEKVDKTPNWRVCFNVREAYRDERAA